MPFYPALVTLLTVALMFATMALVGRARGKYKIKAPAIAGHPQFEAAYRVQMNTLEQTAMFLPVLWLTGLTGNEMMAGILGGAWLLGRVWYMVGYLHSPEKRAMGFLVSILAFFALFCLAAYGLFRHYQTFLTPG